MSGVNFATVNTNSGKVARLAPRAGARRALKLATDLTGFLLKCIRFAI